MSDSNRRSQDDLEAQAATRLDAAQRFASLMTEARVKAGFSQDGAAMSTRISPPFILALESGEFAKLPGKVFARGFVRSLAKVYGTSADPLLLCLEEAHGVVVAGGERISVVRDENAHSVRLRGEIERANRFGDRLRTFLPSHYLRALPLLAIGAGAATLLGMLYFGLNSPSPTEPAAVVVAEGPAAAEAPALEVPAAEVPAAEVPAEPTVVENAAVEPSTAAVLPPAAEVVVAPVAAANIQVLDPEPRFSGKVENSQLLEFTAKEDVKIKISRDDGAWTTEELKPATYQLRFMKQAQVLVYDAGAVELSFNAKPLGPLGAKGKMRRLSFRASEAVPTDRNM